MPARDGKEGPTLVEAIARLAAMEVLPTPTANDANAGGVAGNWTKDSGRHAGVTLTDVAVRGLDGPQRSSSASLNPGESTGIGGVRLNPAFVEWMMGLPPGWSSIPTPSSFISSGMASSRTRRPSRSPSSGNDSTDQLSLFANGDDD